MWVFSTFAAFSDKTDFTAVIASAVAFWRPVQLGGMALMPISFLAEMREGNRLVYLRYIISVNGLPKSNKTFAGNQPINIWVGWFIQCDAGDIVVELMDDAEWSCSISFT